MRVDEVLAELRVLADEEKILQKREKFGVDAKQSLGVHHKDLKIIAKRIGYDDQLALDLFDTGIYEARILCSKVFHPASVTEKLMEKWVSTFENWEICDSFCMGFFANSKYALKKAHEWSCRNEEYVKRAGFVLMASYGFADKSAANSVFEGFFPAIKRESRDDRIYVKKAVNWALRNIGKRNVDLRLKAISEAEELLKKGSAAATWIARDALRELEKPDVKILDYPRNIYR